MFDSVFQRVPDLREKVPATVASRAPGALGVPYGVPSSIRETGVVARELGVLEIDVAGPDS
ncbi:hypothetical protein [Prescottella agglutinans]|uniref:Uncharacterized protein n=1 Tax=Prescottella agglutinans TaxID=1644129 RepID=A0ABT6MI93_9NOCA|nr:hypothetical protein [Prescottella agglutinans]MDH6284017.1 hypothetical protein [Prescottella agglutinans]